MALELLDQPLRIVNPDVELVVCCAQKSPGQLTQLARGGAGQFRQLAAATLIDQAILEVYPDLGIGALKEALDLAEESFVHNNSEAR